jgi:hypothetical protein
VFLSSQDSQTAVPWIITPIPFLSESATFSASLFQHLIDHGVTSVFSQVPSGFFCDFEEMIVKVAIAFPLGVKRNSGSLAKFPAIAIAVIDMPFVSYWFGDYF